MGENGINYLSNILGVSENQLMYMIQTKMTYKYASKEQQELFDMLKNNTTEK